MSRFAQLFSRLRAAKRKALGVYLTVGDPSVEISAAAAVAALDAGADFIELGAPFSDPSADGPAIQRAMERALARGVRFADVAAVARRVRAHTEAAPIVLFGYANPFYRALGRGDLAALHGVADGLLVVDVPPEHDADFRSLEGRMARIRLLGPNATEARRRVIAEHGEGFVYLVAYAGVTGAAATRDLEALGAQVTAMRALAPALPLCCGFGVKTRDDARVLAPLADGVIAGSVFVDALGKAATVDEAKAEMARIVRELRAGLDSGPMS